MAYDFWEHMCQDIFNGKEGTVLVLTAFFDASGDNASGETTLSGLHTVGATIATTHNWTRFRGDWQGLLKRKKVPDFHMKNFEWARSEVIAGRELSEKNCYRGWQVEEFDAFLSELHAIIAKTVHGKFRVFSCGSTTIKADFDKSVPPELKNDPRCASYYIFNAWVAMRTLISWAQRENIDSQLHYVFAGGDGEGNNIEKLFQLLWKDDGERKWFRLHKGFTRIPYGFEKAAKEPALQVADIVAYDLRKDACQVIEHNYPSRLPTSESRKSLQSLARRPLQTWIYNDEKLKDEFDQLVMVNAGKELMKLNEKEN